MSVYLQVRALHKQLVAAILFLVDHSTLHTGNAGHDDLHSSSGSSSSSKGGWVAGHYDLLAAAVGRCEGACVGGCLVEAVALVGMSSRAGGQAELQAAGEGRVA